MLNQLPKCATFYLVFACYCYTLPAQSVQYFPPFDIPASPNHTLQLAGKVENNYLLYSTKPASFPELILLDENGQIAGVRTLDFIRPGIASHVSLVALTERLNIIFQETTGNNHYTVVTSLNKDGQLLEQPRYIDSVRLDLYGSNAFFEVINSADKKFSLLYRIIHGFSETQILFQGIILSERNEVLGNSSFYIPFNTELERTGSPFLTNQGIAYLPVYDKATNYRIGTNLRIYQSAFKNNKPLVNELYLKENKPTGLMLDWYAAKNQLAIGGLYYNFFTTNIEGSFTAFLSPGNNQADTIIYIPLEKSFKKNLKSHIYGLGTNEVINSLQLRYFKVAEDGATTLLTEVFTKSFVSTKSSTSTASLSPGDSYGANNSNPVRNQPVTSGNRTPGGDIALARNTTNPIATRSTLTDRASGSNLERTRNASTTNTQSQNFINSQINTLNRPYQYIPSSADAGDVLSRNRLLDYKSVVFSINGSRNTIWKNWTRSLYVPGTSFSNIIILPGKNDIGLLNYEVNSRNMAYLYSQVFQNDGNIKKQAVSKVGSPMLFYKNNVILLENNSLLTIYADEQQNKIGLAIVNW